jgi:hypothetical protein
MNADQVNHDAGKERIVAGDAPIRGDEDSPVAFALVEAKERDAILHRREDLFRGNLPGVEDLPDVESPEGKFGKLPDGVTVGLALSGGGIRSATFCLGILQVLSRMKFRNREDPETERAEEDVGNRSLLDRVDYLSTVSGGGYIGSWLVASYLRSRCGRTGAAEQAGNGTHASAHSPAFLGETTEALHHLRAFSCYLATEPGMMKPDTWTMATIWARNTFLMQLMIVCCIVSVLLVKRFGAEVFCGLAIWMRGDGCCSAWESPVWWFVLALGVLSACYGLLTICREIDRFGTKKLDRALGQKAVVSSVVVPFLIAAWCFGFALWTVYFAGWTVVPVVQSWAHGFSGGKEQACTGIDIQWQLRCCRFLPGIWWLGGLAVCVGGISSLFAWRIMPGACTSRRVWLTCLTFLGCTALSTVAFFMLDNTLRDFGGFGGHCCHPACHASAGLPAPCGITSGGVPDESGQTSNMPLNVKQNLLRSHLGLLLLCMVSLNVVIMVGLVGRSARDDAREWFSRMGAWLWIFLLSWLCLHLLALVVPRIFFGCPPYGNLMKEGGKMTSVFGAWLLTTILSALAAKSPDTGVKHSSPPLWKDLLARFGPYVAFGGLFVLASLAVHVMMGKRDPLLTSFCLRTVFLLVGFLAGAWVLLLRVDLNEFSMNHFYRNRLVRCYLGASRVMDGEGPRRRPHSFTGFDYNDDLPLARFAYDPESYGEDCYRGPYPLICATLNSSQGGDPATQERRAESFVFTPNYVGSSFARPQLCQDGRHGGYRETWRYANEETSWKPTSATNLQSDNQQHNGLTLGTCVAISGAALSPNCGYHTLPVTAFLLTVVNARLGWWLPSPWKDEEASPAEPRGCFKWLRCLLAELGGAVSAGGEFIYTSDGGHFENLGLYELVRRRCGLIVLCDSEQDGDYKFFGLGTAIRRCRIDFNTEIAIDLTGLLEETEDDPPFRKSHCAVGSISYPADESRNLPASKGVLVYLKSSVTGDEPEDIRQYRARSPEFPHESTGEQFFGESQFESYRRLGEHVAKESLERVWNQSNRMPDSIPEFVRDLIGDHDRKVKAIQEGHDKSPKKRAPGVLSDF